MTSPRIYAPTAIPPASDALISHLNESVATGVEFKVDQTIQISWIWLKIAHDQNGLKVTAPLHPLMPMEFGDDCSDGLNLMIRQRYVADSFGVATGWCNALQSAIVIKDLDQCTQWFMIRMDNEEGNTSGWFIGAQDSKLDANTAENLELISLWELYCRREEVGEFFLLPVGWQVVFEPAPTILNGYTPVEPLPGSYIATKLGSEQGSAHQPTTR